MKLVNIIREILITEILVVKKRTGDISGVTKDIRIDPQNTNLVIERLANPVDDMESNVCGLLDNKEIISHNSIYYKWNAQLAVYWNVIYDNTIVSC